MPSLIHHAEILSLLAEGASLLGRTPDREKIRLLRDRVAETRRMHGLEGSSAGEETLVWLTVLDALVERLLHDQEAMAALSTVKAFYEDVLASLIEGVVVIDPSRRITLVNRAAEEIVGITSEEAVGRSLDEVFRDLTEIASLATQTFETGRSFSNNDALLRRSGGETRAIGVMTSVVTGSGGGITGVVAVLRDLTSVREMEEQVRRAERLSALGVLAAGIAHEVRNPLAGVRGAAQLLRSEIRGNQALVPYTDVIVREVDRLDRIVTGLLPFASPRTFSYGPVNIHSVLDRVLLLEQPRAAAAGVGFQREYDPSLPPVRGNEEQLAQVFLNLVRNGVEAMPQGGRLTLTTRVPDPFMAIRREGERMRMIQVRVADAGVGIPPEATASLFTPFFTTKDHGTGLGLALSHQIVTEHGGAIRVESEPGRGSAFSVTLPMVQEETPPEKPGRGAARRHARRKQEKAG